jgi:hypothetical protein
MKKEEEGKAVKEERIFIYEVDSFPPKLANQTKESLELTKA